MAEKHSGFEATGEVDMGTHKITNVVDPAANQEAATKKYHDDHKYTDAEAVAAVAAADDYVLNDGDTMTGDLLIEPINLATDGARKLTIHENLEDIMISEIVLEKDTALFKGAAPRFRYRMTGDNSGIGLYFYQNTTSLIGKFSVLGANAPSNPNAFQITSSINNDGYIIFGTKTSSAYNNRLKVHNNGKVEIFQYLNIGNIKSGATQAASGAAANEVWKTNGHATLPDNVLMIGV